MASISDAGPARRRTLTAILAALLLGEPLTGPQILGGALVLVGVGIANRLGRPEEEANAIFCDPAASNESEASQ